jgi:hypothetical protein
MALIAIPLLTLLSQVTSRLCRKRGFRPLEESRLGLLMLAEIAFAAECFVAELARAVDVDSIGSRRCFPPGHTSDGVAGGAAASTTHISADVLLAACLDRCDSQRWSRSEGGRRGS